jgi:hypothetical protein
MMNSQQICAVQITTGAFVGNIKESFSNPDEVELAPVLEKI